MKSKTRIAIAASAAFATATALQALPYSWEVYGSYITGSGDIDNLDVDQSDFAAGATYYFPTDTNRAGALRELAFINRASWINGEIEIGEFDDALNDAFDTNAFTARGMYVDADTGWYGAARFVTADADESAESVIGAGFNGTGNNFNGYEVRVGRYIFQNTTLEVGYYRIDAGRNDLFEQSGADSDSAGIGIKHYGTVSDTVGYSLAATYYLINFETADFDDLDNDPFDDDGQVWSMEGVLYPTRALGLGLAYTDADDLAGRPFLTTANDVYDGLGIFAEWFATESLSLRLQYTNSEYDVANFDELNNPNEVQNDTFAFKAGYRF